MFTDLLNLPVDSFRAKQQDQILSLFGMSWLDYEKLTSQEYLSYRVSYFNEIITIVSSSINHEIIERTISILINAYCRKYELLYFPMGSTTLKNPPLAGKEPDTSYSFETRKSIPDLAVEVIYSSSNINNSLEKYKFLNVEEVWFWQEEKIKFYQLADDEYLEINKSRFLSKLTPEFLVEFVNRGLIESPLIIEADFTRELN
ncbi:MAG: Uma2 family endonuclease [Pleurocapsa sp. MO_226.B13]|nr:Uma2 family endonuclease [Pleurocapsa sp. MO_226.B13]